MAEISLLAAYYRALAEERRREAARCRREAQMYRSSYLRQNCLEAAAHFDCAAANMERRAQAEDRQ